MSLAKIVGIVGGSEIKIEDVTQVAIKQAAKNLKGMHGVEVESG